MFYWLTASVAREGGVENLVGVYCMLSFLSVSSFFLGLGQYLFSVLNSCVMHGNSVRSRTTHVSEEKRAAQNTLSDSTSKVRISLRTKTTMAK